MLARRDLSRAELERRLASGGFGVADVAPALDDLERRGLLSDTRLAENTVARRSGRVGRHAIERELRARGVAAPVRASALAALDARDEFDDARRAWSVRFGHPPADDRERARQYRFLIGRGFSAETVLRVLRKAGDHD